MKSHIVAQSENDGQLQVTPKDILEQMLIEEYLKEWGYTLKTLHALSPEKAKYWLTEASQFASLQLTEIESSAHLWAEVKA